MSDESKPAREVFDVPDIGEFRAKRGTAIAELAGASEYWSKRAKAAEKALSKSQWGYFWAGASVASVLAALTIIIKGFFQ